MILKCRLFISEISLGTMIFYFFIDDYIRKEIILWPKEDPVYKIFLKIAAVFFKEMCEFRVAMSTSRRIHFLRFFILTLL